MSELERLKQLEQLRRMELEIIEREKKELEMGLIPTSAFPPGRGALDPLLQAYRQVLAERAHDVRGQQ